MGSSDQKEKGYLAMLRCSTPQQADTSPEDQHGVIRRHPVAKAKAEVGIIRLDGLSASNPENIDRIIEDIIRRKVERNDFDTVMAEHPSRVTRSGPDHGGSIRYRLFRAGIRLIYATDPELDDSVAPIYQAFKDQQSRFNDNAHTIARGLSSALVERRKAHCSRPPFGIDRLYLSSQGEPSYRIRNLPDGTQVKLGVDSDEVLDRFGRNPRKGAPVHHRKQKHERVALIPGDPIAQETVGLIYRWRLVEDLGVNVIATRLNSLGRAGPDLNPWRPSAVRSILGNSAYYGYPIAMRTSAAKFSQATKDGPKKVRPESIQRTASNNPATIIRPASEWLRIDEEQLHDYLPADLRELAAARHEQLQARQAGGHTPTPRRDAARESDFLLSGLLRSARGGSPMTGTQGGRKGGYGYYRVSPRDAHPADRGFKPIRREPVEQVALDLIRQTLLSDPEFETTVTSIIRERDAERRQHQGQRDSLVSERAELQAKIAMLMANRATTPTAVSMGLQSLEPRSKQIEEALAEMDETPALTEEQVQDRTKRLIDLMQDRAGLLATAPTPYLKATIRSLICGMTIDLETCALRIEVCSPDPADAEALKAMGPLSSLVYGSTQRTQQAERLPLTVISRPWPGGPCCRRRRRAA